MRQAGPGIEGDRVRGLIVVLWRAGLRIGEALDLAEADLDPGRGALLVRRGKGGKRREAGMDDRGWQQLRPWLAHRTQLPPGPLFCVIRQALRRERCPRQPSPPRRPSRRAAPLCASPAAACPRIEMAQEASP
jgi:integrase